MIQYAKNDNPIHRRKVVSFHESAETKNNTLQSQVNVPAKKKLKCTMWFLKGDVNVKPPLERSIVPTSTQVTKYI